MKNKGFSLIELLVVVALIGILAAVGVAAYQGYVEGTKVIAVKSNCNLAVRHLKNQLMRCVTGTKIQGWSGVANLGTGVYERDCDISPNLSDRFIQDFGNTMAVLAEDANRYPNLMRPNDVTFKIDSSPPTDSQIGRCHCGVNQAVNPDLINCYGRWGIGHNEYTTQYIINLYK